MIVYRPLQTPSEVRQFETVQQAAWGMSDREIMPYNSLHAWMHAGGLALGAFDGDQLIGFAASFLGEIGGKKLHWSHMTAVLPAYQRQGIGRALKFAQRDYVLRQGIRTIGWTFDPLRRQNAIFNLEILGAVPQRLMIEHYGKMTDAINQGLLSDRFDTYWDLRSKRVKACEKQKRPPFLDSQKPSAYVTCVKDHAPHIDLPTVFDAPEYAIELPSNVDTLRQQSPDLTHRWYYALREVVPPLLAAGYQFERVYCASDTPQVFAYVLQKAPAWFVYMLRTADDTLYTGITNDLDKRLQAHNAGKGAKYTATRRPVTLVAAWETSNRSTATKLERQMKQLSRPQKDRLVASQADFHHAKRIR